MAHFTNLNEVKGNFQESKNGLFFDYRQTDNEWAIENGLNMEVCVQTNPIGGNGYRFAKILNTIVYIAVDEDENGKPILEKWKIKNHFKFS